MSKKEQQPETKKYGLTDLEKRMIQVMVNRHNEEYSNFLTYICLSRLSVKVSQNTQFKVNEQGELEVTEMPAPEEKKEEVAQA